MRRWLLVCPLICVGILGIAYGWIHRELRTPHYSCSTPEVFVDIPQGAHASQSAKLLEEAGVLNHRLPFLLYLHYSGHERRLQAGEYQFASPATPIQIAQRLVRGDVFFHSVRIPEGLTALETIAHIVRTGLGQVEEFENALGRTEWVQDVDPQARDLEGYLFPDTYRFPRKATAEQILRTLVDRFTQVFRKLQSESPIPGGWNTRVVVTLASIVEKEVKNDAERGLVASVLANRLQKNIPLACDPTIIYALKLAGRYDGNIRKADLGIQSPYNTYLSQGLPPGPVANPGAGSLKAVLAYPKTDLLYFVSRNDGTHQFSASLQSHARAVARFQPVLGPRVNSRPPDDD